MAANIGTEADNQAQSVKEHRRVLDDIVKQSLKNLAISSKIIGKVLEETAKSDDIQGIDTAIILNKGMLGLSPNMLKILAVLYPDELSGKIPVDDFWDSLTKLQGTGKL